MTAAPFPRRKRADGQPATGRQATCEDKIRYFSRKAARSGRNSTRGGSSLHIYICPFCDFFHLGRLPTDVLTGKVEKDAYVARRRSR